MPAVGDPISAATFNAIVAKIEKVLGDDGVDPQVGYGRAITSSTVSSGDVFDADLMTPLYNDLVKARTHQKGSANWDTSADGLDTPDAGEYIGAFAADIGTGGTSATATADTDEGFLDFEQAAQDILDDINDVALAQTSVQSINYNARTTQWNGSINHNFDVVFANANERRYFFNSGGYIQLDAELTGGNSVAGDQTQTYPNTPAYQKDEIWQTMLNTMGSIRLGKNATTSTGSGTAQAIGNYELTTTYQTIFQKDGSGVYSENFYRVQARTAPSAANKIQFRVTFSDSDLGDNRDADLGFPGEGIPVDENVTGTVSSSISSRAATGALGINHPSSVTTLELNGGGAGTSYTLTANRTSINEGGSTTITLSTTGVPNGTNVPYTVTGVNASDLSSGSLTGNFTINSGSASRSFGIANDFTTEGQETLTLTLDNNQADIDIAIGDTSVERSFTLTSNDYTPNEGDTITMTFTTTGPDSDNFWWRISSLGAFGTAGASDFTSAPPRGDAAAIQFNPTNGQFTFDITMAADSLTEGSEYFTVFVFDRDPEDLRGSEGLVASRRIDIVDTSTSPPPPTISGISSFGDSYIYGFSQATGGAGTIIRFYGDGDIHMDKRNGSDNDGVYNTQVQNTTPVGTWLPAGRTADEYEIRLYWQVTAASAGSDTEDLNITATTGGFNFAQFSASATAAQGITFYLPSSVGFSELSAYLEIEIREIANTAVSTTFTGNALFNVEQ